MKGSQRLHAQEVPGSLSRPNKAMELGVSVNRESFSTATLFSASTVSLKKEQADLKIAQKWQPALTPLTEQSHTGTF